MNKLICTKCHKKYGLNETIWRCECGGMLDIEFKPRFDIDRISRRPVNLWRYREALPIDNDQHIVSFNEGFTPLVECEYYDRRVLAKLDYQFPSGSFKDRGASIMISKARELGIKKVVEDSSGNAGSAIAAYCARAGIECEIFVPKKTASAKVAQIRAYGAKINNRAGSREAAAQAALKTAEDIYYASHYWNPFFFQGTKTLAFEVCEQMYWHAPDSVILPVGGGSLLLGAYIGFTELLAAGIIQHLPRLIGVQASACAPLVKAFNDGEDTYQPFDKKPSIAEGIANSAPLRGNQVLTAVRMSNGRFYGVSEEEIKTALVDSCRKGFFIEPTAAVVLAGVKHYLKNANANERIVVCFTGHGLKNPVRISSVIDKKSGDR